MPVPAGQAGAGGDHIIDPPGQNHVTKSWYHHRYVCIIYVGTLPSANIFTMNIIPEDGTGFNGNVVVQGSPSCLL